MAERRRSPAPGARGKIRSIRAGRIPDTRKRRTALAAAPLMPPVVAVTAHEPRHDVAEAVMSITERLRERLMAAGSFQAEVAAQFERLAQILAAVAGGHALPPVMLMLCSHALVAV